MDMVQLLLGHRADVNIKVQYQGHNRTARQIAEANGFTDLVRCFEGGFGDASRSDAVPPHPSWRPFSPPASSVTPLSARAEVMSYRNARARNQDLSEAHVPDLMALDIEERSWMLRVAAGFNQMSAARALLTARASVDLVTYHACKGTRNALHEACLWRAAVDISASSRIRTAPHRSPQRVRRRAIRHARSPQRVRRRAQGFARHHSESAPTRPIPAEGSSASSRIRTAPHRSLQRVRRRAMASDPTRPIPAEGSPASSRIRTAPQRERSDTPDPCGGFIGELKDSHGTTPISAEGSPASDPTRPIPVEGSSASSRIRTAPHRSPQRVRRRAIRHARSL